MENSSTASLADATASEGSPNVFASDLERPISDSVFNPPRFHVLDCNFPPPVREIDPRNIEVVDDIVAGILRRKTSGDRVRMITDMWETASSLLIAGIKTNHPNWSDEIIRIEARNRVNGNAGRLCRGLPHRQRM